jgi:hypothetical protein
MAFAKPSLLSWSRLVVGSSKARIPQLRQKDSANASRITNEAKTWRQGGKIEQKPRPSDQWHTDLLTGRTAAFHGQFCVALHHDNTVVKVALAGGGSCHFCTIATFILQVRSDNKANTVRFSGIVVA